MAFDLSDEELKVTRIMNGTASKEELYKRIAELEEIEKENGELREKVKNSISILKIKEIIEELEKQEDWYIEHKSLDDLYGKIDILQELLEERND